MSKTITQRMQNSKYLTLFYAISMAMSWAWGTSLVVGMQTVQEKGTIPFLIWATANSLALPLFGFIAFRIKNLDRVVNSKIVMVFTTLVHVFSIWIQMNAIYQILSEKTGLLGDVPAKAIAIAVAAFFVIALVKNGLMRGVAFDQPLGLVCYATLILIAIVSFATGSGFNDIPLVANDSDIAWAFNSCFILFSGPIMNLQNWNLARKVYEEHKMNAYYWAGGIFACYLGLVYLLANLQLTAVTSVMLAIAVMCVATSTLDEAIVGVQKIGGKKIGFAIGVFAVCFWNWVAPLGVMGLWTTMGNMRKWVALACVIIALGIGYMAKRNKAKELNG